MPKAIKPVHHDPMRGWSVVMALGVIAGVAAVAVVVMQLLGVI